MTIQAKPNTCPHCDGRRIIKKGLRQNQYRRIQIYQCKDCRKYFSPATIKRSKYPPHLIVKALSLYYQGYSQPEVAKLLALKHRVTIPPRTISEWLARYRAVCTFARLRAEAVKRFDAGGFIRSHTLTHRQVYIFKLHQAKLDLLSNAAPQRTLERLKAYLRSVPTAGFPHHLFQAEDEAQPARRSSQTAVATLALAKVEKQNLANDLATLGLLLARTNRERHPAVQDFMLTTDSTTVACEVPVYLTKEERDYFAGKGFVLGLPEGETPITGHIDTLQVRNGLIHILDYKPEAHKVNAVSQLVIYALALASRTRLPVSAFKCAWFDDKHYYEFFPLHAVYPKRHRTGLGL